MVKSLNNNEKSAFTLHLTYEILNGVMLGVLALNEFVFLRSMQGSNYQMSVLFQFSMMVFLFLVFFNEFLKRIPRKRKLLRITGFVTRIPLLLVLLFPNSDELLQSNPIYHLAFLGIFLVYYLGDPVIKPTINLLLKANYRHQNFGRLFSIATSASNITMLLVTFGYGYLLDYNKFSFTYVLPLAGGLSVLSLFLLSQIQYTPVAVEHGAAGFFSTIRKSVVRMVHILKENHTFRHFEIAFMFYGIAFMMSVTVIYIYFEKDLALNYASMAFYRNSYYVLAIVLLPYFGKLLGNIDPRKFGVIAYAAVLFYILTLFVSQWFNQSFSFLEIQIYYVLLFYILFRGLFAGTMPLMFNIGSAYFCRNEDADIYQSVHLSLTGFRSIFAPVIGVFVYEQFGFSYTLLVSAFFMVLAIVMLGWSYFNNRKIEKVIAN